MCIRDSFDTHETFIDESYAAEIQAMKIVMMRTCEELMRDGKSEKAAEMAKKFFSAFPHFNFPYDDSVMPFIETLNETGHQAEAREHMDILATELYQRLLFYDSLDESEFESFRQDYGFALRGTTEILKSVDGLGDAEFAKRIKELISQYDISNVRKG